MELFIYFVIGAMLLIVIGMLVSVIRLGQSVKSLEKGSDERNASETCKPIPAKTILQQRA